MYNGFDLPLDILNKHLNFIREEISRVENQITELENMKSYHQMSDDAKTLLQGLKKIKYELNVLLRHDYDAEEMQKS